MIMFLISRFGSFEIFKPMSAETGRKGPSVGRTDILIQMLDYTIKTFYKDVSTIRFINFQMLENFAVINLKFKQRPTHRVMFPNDAY